VKWMQYLLALLALAGAVVSVQALRVHNSTDAQPCSINEKWDCGVVNHSRFAEINHVPVAVIGIAGYLVLCALAFTGQRFLTFLAALVGFGFAFRLTVIEELVLEVWCLYCVASQAIIGLIVLLSLAWLAVEYWSLRRANARRVSF